jgi:epoxyqueuosine reductase
MDLISNTIRDAMKTHGYQARTVAITHLPEVQEAVGQLVRQGLINRRLSEKWHFHLETNKNFPEARNIIIVAMPQPITRLSFSWQGNVYPAEVAPNFFKIADEKQAEKTLRDVLGNAGYIILKARLALKTLAVRSGLARYGKNNLAYVSGMGTFVRLIAFYTDAPCDENDWQEPGVMKECHDCSLCRENCPTGSITTDSFLIHAEKCLGFLYDSEPGIPHWVKRQPDWPNAFIGCMRCQSACPVNKPYLKNIVNGPSFSEAETEMIINNIPWEQLSSRVQHKLEDIRGVYPLIAYNLAALMEKQHQARQR